MFKYKLNSHHDAQVIAHGLKAVVKDDDPVQEHLNLKMGTIFTQYQHASKALVLSPCYKKTANVALRIV